MFWPFRPPSAPLARSGKTHAIFGADALDTEDPELGLLHLMIQHLYQEMAHQRSAHEENAFTHIVQPFPEQTRTEQRD